MEMQLVHKDNSSNYLMMAVFLKADATLTAKCIQLSQNHTYCKRANFLDAVLLGGMTELSLLTAVAALDGAPSTFRHTVANVLVDPYANIVPPIMGHFYTYNGSFTTPPCTTGVKWVLNPNHVLVYDTSILFFKKIMLAYAPTMLTTGPTGGANNRPIQPLGNRTLYFVGQTGHTMLTAAATAGSTILSTWSHAGFSIGDSIIIDAGTYLQEVNRVIGFGSMTLAAPLQYTHAAGATVASQATTTPGITTTPGDTLWASVWGIPTTTPGFTTTPAATATPILPWQKSAIGSDVVRVQEQLGFGAHFFLGGGCLVGLGLAVIMVVRGVRSRMRVGYEEASHSRDISRRRAEATQSREISRRLREPHNDGWDGEALIEGGSVD